MPAPTIVPLPTTATGLASIPLTLPAADQQPGPYLVQATLIDTSTSPPTTLGTTCLPYTVGATGDSLNLASLPDGVGSGGPADPRGVALNAQLGLDRGAGTLVQLEHLPAQLQRLGPDGSDLWPLGHDLRQRPDQLLPGGRHGAADHVAYWIQVGGGDSVSPALVNNGWWQGDIRPGRLLRQPPRRVAAGAPR